MEAKELRKQLKRTDEEYYEVTVTLQVDDEAEENKTYLFRGPEIPSYDRYSKTVQTSNSKILTASYLDNIHPDQRETLEADFKEYPAMTLSVGERLLAMFSLSKATVVRKLQRMRKGELKAGFVGTNRLFIHTYLPSGMIPGGLDGMDADDFACLADLARCARRWRRGDLEQGFTRAPRNLSQE